MSRITRAEKWFGKKKKDLNEEERKEFEKLYSQEVKQYQVEYHKKWRKENPEKVKEYYTKYNNENKTLKEENDKLKQQIADLEAKLTECEKKFVAANNLRKNSDEVLLNYKTEKYGLDKTIQELRKIKLSLPEKEWYYKGFENCERQMSSHIADLTLEVKELKQRLEESELETARWQEHFEQGKLDYNCLKEELAEKDKEIKKLNNIIFMSQLQAPKEQILNILGSQCIQYNPDKAKIDYAVEQLEKVKDIIYRFDVSYDEINNLTIALDNYTNGFHKAKFKATILIDNQIKQLKEGK